MNWSIDVVTLIVRHWLDFFRRSSSLSAAATASESRSSFALASANDSCMALVTILGGQDALFHNHSGLFHHNAWLVTSPLRLPIPAGLSDVLM